jgi:hypothetical protein
MATDTLTITLALLHAGDPVLTTGRVKAAADQLAVSRWIRAWLNGLRTTCQCCAQGKVTERAMKGTARCCAKKPAECCEQVAGTGTLRYLLRLVRAALQDAVEEEVA